MKLSRKDITAVAISTAITAVAGYALYVDIAGRTAGSGEPVGTIAFKKRIAQRKFSDDVVWEGLSQNANVYNLDYIRTDTDSSATITFNDGTAIDLEENSMVLISRIKGKISIGFEGGTISASAGKAGTIDIIAGKTRIALKQGGAVIGGSKAAPRLTVNTGTAQIAGGNTVSASQSTVLSGGAALKVENVAITLQSPVSGSILTITDDSPPIPLTWSGGVADIELSKDPRFNSRVLKGNGNGSFAARLEPGRYYWRASRNGTVSLPANFTVVRLEQPTPLSPEDGADFFTTGSALPIRFTWSSGTMTGGTVIVSRTADLSNPLIQINSETSSFTVDTLTEGTWFWGITLSSSGSITRSPVRSFRISRREKAPAVKLLFPADGAVISSGSGSRTCLGWEKNDSAVRYRIELTRNEFDRPEFKAESPDNFISLPESVGEGSYQWRVFAIDARGTMSDASVPFSFKATRLLPLRYATPSEGSVHEPGAINFSWADANAGNSYRIEISSSRNFAKPVNSTTAQSTAAVISLNTPGRYYYRISLLDSSGRTSLTGPVQSFSIPTPLRAPVITAPRANSEIDLNAVNRIPLRWSKVNGANQYDVVIKYRLAGNEMEILRTSTTKPSLDITDFSKLKLGTLRVEVRAVSRSANLTGAVSPAAEANFILTMKDNLAAPVLISPGVIYVR